MTQDVGSGNGTETARAQAVFDVATDGMDEKGIYQAIYRGKFRELEGTRVERRREAKKFSRDGIKALKRDGLLKTREVS